LANTALATLYFVLQAKPTIELQLTDWPQDEVVRRPLYAAGLKQLRRALFAPTAATKPFCNTHCHLQRVLEHARREKQLRREVRDAGEAQATPYVKVSPM